MGPKCLDLHRSTLFYIPCAFDDIIIEAAREKGYPPYVNFPSRELATIHPKCARILRNVEPVAICGEIPRAHCHISL